MRTDEMAAVLAVYAKAVKDGDVSACPTATPEIISAQASALPFMQDSPPCHARSSRQLNCVFAGTDVLKVQQCTKSSMA